MRNTTMNYDMPSVGQVTHHIYSTLTLALDETPNGVVTLSNLCTYPDMAANARVKWVVEQLARLGLVGYVPARRGQRSEVWLEEYDRDEFHRIAFEDRKAFKTRQQQEQADAEIDTLLEGLK